MSKYKLIIFDFDGTLGNTLDWFSKRVNSAARLFRFREITPQDWPILRGLGTREILKYLEVSPWKLPFIATYMRFMMRRDMASLKLFHGVDRLIQALHTKGMLIAIVSSNSEFNIRGIMPQETVGLIDHFSCGSSLFGKKQKFLQGAKKLNVTPQDVLCIGDESRDVEAAREAGMASGAVTWGYAGLDILKTSRPTYIFDHVDEILKLVP